MVKVRMPSIPIAVPVRIMTRHNVIANASNTLIRLPSDYRARSLCARTIGLRLHVRRMPKRRKAGPCALKARNTSWGAHSAKAYSAATGANSGYDMSATIEPTAVETAAAKVATAESSTAEVAATKASTAMAPAASASPSTATATAASEGLTHCCE